MSGTAPLKRSGPESGKIRHFRWYICGLLLWATTVNYMDRMVLSILKPTIGHNLHWTETQYGWINAVFQFGYAVMMPFAGRLIDWLGLRAGYSISTFVWSISSMSHALARTVTEFGVARLGLGLGEAANFPACLKAVADWFPQRERALAAGIFNGGANIGAMTAPLLIPIVTVRFGWQFAFLFTGSLSFIWVIVWLLVYREPEQHRRLSAEELMLIRSDGESAPLAAVPYRHLLDKRPAWAYVVGKFLTDPVWWFYLFWLPDFLHRKYGVDLLHIGAPLLVVYAAATIGSVTGGWLSSLLLAKGWTVSRARKTAMLVPALTVGAVMFVPVAAGNLWVTVVLIGIAAGSHQGFSANLLTVPSDCFPRAAVGSVVGLGGFSGAVGGMLAQPLIGKWLDFSHDAYAPLFVVAGTMYLLALLIVHVLLPRFERVLI